MKSYHMTSGAGLAGLVLREHAPPKPGPRQVLVRVRAVSLNFRELMILLRGTYPLPVKPDVIAVSDGAGEIVAVGEGVTRAKVGDRVIASIFPRWLDGAFDLAYAEQLGGSLDGMLTELAVLSEDAVVPVPEHLSFDEAATLPCAALTAWHALTVGRPPSAGDTVLTLGSGGVSLFALQLAKLFGARVVATTSSPEKGERLRALGADEVIDYRATPDWPAAVRRVTGGRGADRIVDVGGTLGSSFEAVARGGEIALVGLLGGATEPVDPASVFGAGATLRTVAVGSRAQLVAMNRAIGLHRLRPVIDRVFAFDEARDAFAYYAAGKSFGKVIIRVGA